jgi:hypothetical protein
MRSSNVTVSLLLFMVLGRTTSALTLHSSSSSSFVRAASLFQAQCSSSNDASTGHCCTLYMRKQKASDKRTRRLQREGGVNTLSSSSITQSPMEQAGLWKVKDLTKQTSTAQPRSAAAATTTMTPTAVQTQSVTGGGGRGRSRKRSTLYNSISFYHDKFLHLLTAEYQAEVRVD